MQLPTSVGYDHPEDCVGHGQYSTVCSQQSVQLNQRWCVVEPYGELANVTTRTS